MTSEYDSDVDKSVLRTINRYMLISAEGRAARNETHSNPVLRFCGSFGVLGISLWIGGQELFALIVHR